MTINLLLQYQYRAYCIGFSLHCVTFTVLVSAFWQIPQGCAETSSLAKSAYHLYLLNLQTPPPPHNNSRIIHNYCCLGRMCLCLSPGDGTVMYALWIWTLLLRQHKGMKPKAVTTWGSLRSPVSICCLFSNGMPPAGQQPPIRVLFFNQQLILT